MSKKLFVLKHHQGKKSGRSIKDYGYFDSKMEAKGFRDRLNCVDNTDHTNGFFVSRGEDNTNHLSPRKPTHSRTR
jgi:hypothetical protein